MNKKGNLFKLIQSLSQTEKRYFRLFCRLQKGDSYYLKLFDELDAMEVYDEDKLRLKSKDESFLPRLAVTKNHLQHLIMKSLRNYHEKMSIDSEMTHLILNVEILYQKELFDLCQAHLEKARKLADKVENFTALAALYEWERRLYIAKYGASDSKFKETVHRQAEAIGKMQTLSGYWGLMASATNADFGASVEDTVLNHELIKKNKADSMMSEVLHYQVLYTANMLRSRSDKSEEYIDRVIAILEDQPGRIKHEPRLYSTSLGNKVSLLIFQKRWDEAGLLLEKIRQIPSTYGLTKRSKFSVRTICRSYNLELEIYRDKKDIQGGCDLIAEVSDYLEQHASSIPDDYYMLFWHQFSNLYFMNKAYSEALTWINKIIDSKLKPYRSMEVYARILHLMVHFELGNIVFMKYAIDSHRRYFKSKKLLNTFLKQCLNFFGKVSMISKTEQKVAFKSFHQQLFGEEKKMVLDSILDYIDIKSWLEAKL